MAEKRFSALADLGALAVVFMSATVVAAICAVGMAGGSEAAPGGSRLFFAYTLQFLLAVAGGLIWLRRGGDFRLRFGVGWSAAPLVLTGMVLVTATGIVIEPLLGLFSSEWFDRLSGLIGRGGWSILTTVVAAPVLEEIFFRGMMLETLSRKWRGGVAVVVTALFFGLAHAPNPPQMINAFVVAVSMGFIYLSSRSLPAVIIIHALNNGLAYLTFELTGSQSTDTRALLNNDTLYWTIYAAACVVIVFSTIFLARRARTKNHRITLNSEIDNAKTAP
jgi:membrane protease YdiL (CAAX protease family)